jgi:hypothetical protein
LPPISFEDHPEQEAVTQQMILMKMYQEIAAMFQLQARIALGWDPAEAVVDMKLNVPPPPQKGENRHERRHKGRSVSS